MVRKRTKKRRIKKTRSSRGRKDVDRISALSNDLLVKILTCLPTRVAASTTVLSKRWECLWMWLPKLRYCCSDLDPRSRNIGSFLDRNMPLHRAPVIERFHLALLASSLSPKHIETWLANALSRNLRELSFINECYNEKPNILPSRLYTCKTLVILKLRGMIRLDVPRLSCLPSLKTLELLLHIHFEGESLRRLLSICPVLENLYVFCGWKGYDKEPITVTVPSLRSLKLYLSSETEGVLPRGLLIDSPSLKYLKFRDCNQWSRPGFSIETMPDLEEAYVNVQYCKMSSSLGLMAPTSSIKCLMRSITSVKRLTICSEMCYSGGFVFNQLEHLKLCVCKGDSSNLLARLLEDSPNLRVLDIFEIDHDDRGPWDDNPTTNPTVRESVLSNLQTFNWSRYFERRPQEMDLAVYILGEKWSLKVATISSDASCMPFFGDDHEVVDLLPKHRPSAKSYFD